MAKSHRTVLAALLLAAAVPSLAAAQSIGEPTDPATWRTPEFMAQWGLYWINAEFAYARGLDGTGVEIGIVDTGLATNHPEFLGRYAPGFTYRPDKPWNSDPVGHGTGVASIIVANRDGKGMHGVAPGATIVLARADGGGGAVDHAASLFGIRSLIGRGVRIINNSYNIYRPIDDGTWGKAWEQPVLDGASTLDIYREAVKAGGLLIWSAGNAFSTSPSGQAGLPYLYPDLESGWLAVTALGPGYMPQYSNWCGVAMTWCLAAPGGGRGDEWDPVRGEWVWMGNDDGILKATPDGGYDKAMGTSLAAPHVAGAAALVAQAFPYMTMSQVRQVLLGTAQDVGDPGVDPVFGYGLLDVGKAVRGPGKFDWGDFVADVPSGRSTWENDITGNGGLVKAGDGALILTGDSSYRSDTRIAQGVLAVNGSIRSNTFIEPEGMLSGGGTVHGDVQNGGAVYGGYGSQGGTLTIDGDYTQSPDAGLMVMVGAPKGTSRVDVTGSATVSGWVHALVPMGGYRGDARYTVLTALGGISGRFEDDCGCYAFLDLKLSYDPTAVHLDVARNKTAFAEMAASRNGAAVADAVEALGIGQPFYDLAVTLNGADAASLFGQLPGEAHGSTVTGLIETGQLIGTQINDRLRSAFGTVGAEPLPLLAYGDEDITTASLTPAERYGAWGSAFGSWGSTDSDGNAGKLSRSTGGFVTGLDGLVTDDWRLGFLAGYSHSSFRVADRKSSASAETYHLGIYGGREWGALAFRSGLTYSWSAIDSGRQLAFYDLGGSESSSHRAGTTQVFGELGYAMKAGTVAFEPFANLAYVNVHSSGFTEQGGAAALSVYGGSNDVTFTTLGLRASTGFDIGAMKATARGMLGWRHGFGDVTPTVTQALSGSPAFSTAGAPLARDAAIVEAGLDFAIAPAASLGVSYQGQIGTKARDHGFRADLSVRF